MPNGRLNSRDRLYIRLANDGTAIANSALWRSRIPRGQGHWKDITSCVLGCCNLIPQGMLISAQDFTQGTVTGISFPGYSWTGNLGAGGDESVLAIPLPYDFAETITFTFSAITGTGVDITTATYVGTGTMTADLTFLAAGAAGQTVVFTVTSDPGSQYLITLADD